MWNFVENCFFIDFRGGAQIFWLIFDLISTISTNFHVEIKELQHSEHFARVNISK